ncbi:hypothetical protein G647_06015 [Cladophialophora carrionii CBS 160.54]|uniref:PHD-type domain-containing protein n=1 Tax=Cladophialophora carrionii CBS 160.54 TaxID=1279043 RepID=V9D502_9EURO|nr:uncharacterized protein G647_06015 [Cladophialophora carrionii CBS 160.54]ETI21945.1 hypothetical protein G647_06015 [Cladophialophora carrionii CBS 160.54]
MSRKRTRDEMEASEPQEKKEETSLLQRIRNMWEFASVMQFIFTFGKAVKIDEDFDIEDFENECLKPGNSEKLEEIGLTLLKWISSHRGLNYDIWDEYTRRQYLAKAPHLNPYGDDEEPKRFRDFDICTKIRILHQLTVWTFWNPDRMREKMSDHPREADQTEWRIEEFGYDREDRQYYLLDDNRFYRRTEPPLPAAPKAKPKANSKKAIAARRRESKRRRLEAESVDTEEDNEDNTEETEAIQEEKKLDSWEIDTFGGFKWECLCINLPDYQEFCESLKKSKDANEKILRQRLLDEVIPVIEAAEEKRRRKIERREKELLMMERMVGAKRSSRLADKHDRERRDAEQAEMEKKRQADLAAAHREQVRQEKMEQERQYRMMTREQRIKDREYKRLLKEEELARDELEQKRIEEGQIRGSDRALKQRMERNKKELEDLDADEDWTFDCSGCGVYGKNLDDGTHIISCERCNVWQHSKCLGISKSAAEKKDFHFVCKECRQKEEDSKKPKISLKFRVGASSSPAPPSPAPVQSTFVGVEVPLMRTHGPQSNGHLSTPGQSTHHPQPSPVNGTYHQQLPGSPQRPHPGSPQHPQGYGSRSLHSGYQAIQPHPPSVSNNQARSPPPPGAVNPPSHYNGVSHQYQNYPVAQRPLAPSPIPKHSASAPNSSPNSARLPSPVLNRPTMSPTQGNMDVGPVAGIPQKASQSPELASNGIYGPANTTPSQSQVTPRATHQNQLADLHQTPISRTPNYPLSGLSPRKQQTPGPLPAPSAIPQKSATASPPLSTSSTIQHGLHPTNEPTMPTVTTAPYPGEKRSVSGTPILPPVENLRPSPQQLRNSSSNGPVPTPSKQLQPHPHSHVEAPLAAEHKVNEQASTANMAHTADGGGEKPADDPRKEAPVAKREGGIRTGPDALKELNRQTEVFHNAEDVSHPGSREVVMEDVQ